MDRGQRRNLLEGQRLPRPSRREAGSGSSHHPRPTPQPRHSGRGGRVRSAWSLGCSPQAKSWALTSELTQGRWGQAHPRWTDGQGQHVRSGGKCAKLLWGWTGSLSAASPPMSFALCLAQGPPGVGWGSPAARPPEQPSFRLPQQCGV